MRLLFGVRPTPLLAVVLINCLGPLASANVLIDFESSLANTPAPFSIVTGGGLTATFAGDGLAICDISSYGFTMQAGNAAIVNGCATQAGNVGAAIDIVFSQPVYGVSMDFATFPDSVAVQLTALQNGNSVGTASATGTGSTGFGEAIIQFGGGLPNTAFNEIQLNTDTQYLSIDNIGIQTDAVPEPAGLILLSSGSLLLILARRRRSR